MVLDNLRRRAETLLARAAAPRFLYGRRRFHHVMGEAIRLRSGRLSESDFVAVLADYFDEVGAALADEICLGDLRAAIEDDTREIELDRIRGDAPGDTWRRRLGLRGRRFELLRMVGVYPDVWVLRAGEVVGPHAHHRVCAGLMVLEGSLAIRTYDRVGERGGAVLLEPRDARDLGPGDYTIASEHAGNVHWFGGLAPRSLAFRVEVRDVPVRPFAPRFDELDDIDPRAIYVDPTVGAGSGGAIEAPYVDRERAAAIASAIVDGRS